jgi:hypothetical protein
MQRQPGNLSYPITIAILTSRLGLFLIFQALIALLASSWETSEHYWLLTATLTNIVSIILLHGIMDFGTVLMFLL